MTDKRIRTRFAPSPTGVMHVGSVRTAIFGWLLARQQGGSFILRIEDTDKKREVEGSTEHIAKTLDWLGIDRDEGPFTGGDLGPYLQSERLEIYKEWCQKLIDSGHAYAEPYTPEQIDAFRQQAHDDKKPFLYRNHRPEDTSTPDDWYGNHAIRFKVPVDGRVEWHDEVRGDLSAGPESLNDIILMKADGYPTYNFAHIVDDHLMKITHVIRGEEFISSTPNYILLYKVLGLPQPALVTVPPILGENGGKKLSKRDGAKDVLGYAEDGFTPTSLINFLANIGWNDGTEDEIFTVEELTKRFSLDRIQKSGGKFDIEKLSWISGHHIRNMTLDELYVTIEPKFWPESSTAADDEYKKQVLGLVQERLKHFDELTELTEFFFQTPEYSEETFVIKKIPAETVLPSLDAAKEKLMNNDFSEASLEEALRSLVDELDTKPGKLFQIIRAAVSGQDVAPGLFETMALLSKDECLKRIDISINTVK